MAVHEPPLGLPFVDSTFYVARPWVEWLLLAQVNIVELDEDVDDIQTDIAQIDINTAAIAVNTAGVAANVVDITALEAADVVLTASVLSNEALSFYFASL